MATPKGTRAQRFLLISGDAIHIYSDARSITHVKWHGVLRIGWRVFSRTRQLGRGWEGDFKDTNGVVRPRWVVGGQAEWPKKHRGSTEATP